MIKKIIFILLIAVISVNANHVIVKDLSNIVKTQNPIETNSVYLGSYLAQGHLPARDIYRIDVPVGGIVEKLNVSIYEHVHKNKLLAIIKSPKILELESIYINLLIEEEYNENELLRLKPLYEAAVVSKKQYLKAKNTFEKYKTQVQFYYHFLQEWGLSKLQVDTIKKTKKPIPEINIYAPISGIISDLKIFPKMYLAQGAHMVTIINEHGTHLEVSLPLAIAKKLRPNSQLFIEDMLVEVESVSAEIDLRTQTLAVHLLAPQSMKVIPNEKRSVKLFWPKDAMKIASSSILQYNDKSAIFIKTEDGFRLIYVTLLSRRGDIAYILSDEITLKDEIAVSGVLSLKASLEAAE